jgi:hypothetical protein
MSSCSTLWESLLCPLLLSGQVVDIISFPTLLTDFEFLFINFIVPFFPSPVYIQFLDFASVSLRKDSLWEWNAHIGLIYNLWFSVLHFFGISLSHEILFIMRFLRRRVRCAACIINIFCMCFSIEFMCLWHRVVC